MNHRPDYFRFFGLDRRLSLDLDDLRTRFYDLSRRIHPDKFLRSAPNEQRCSLDAAATLNDAYRTLRDPVARAEYVLKAEGFDIGERKSKDVPPELLQEVFELNMLLEELRSGDTSARPQLERVLEKFQSMREAVDGELSRLFAEYDRTGGRNILVRIRDVLSRRRYVANLVSQAERDLAA